FLPLGLEIPEDHPDRSRYFSMKLRSRQMDDSDVAELTLMSRGDILFLTRTAYMTAATTMTAGRLNALSANANTSHPGKFRRLFWITRSSATNFCCKTINRNWWTTKPPSSLRELKLTVRSTFR